MSVLLGMGVQGAAAFTPPGLQPCSIEADCDDGLVCNGQETCVSGFCAAGTAPCGTLACREPGLCAGRPLLATTTGQMGWQESGALDAVLRLGLGDFQPQTGRLFDERTYTPSDVGNHFVATPASDPDFAAIADEFSNGQSNQAGVCRETFMGGMTSQSTCEPTSEQGFFGLSTVDFAGQTIDRIDLVIDSMGFAPVAAGTRVQVAYEFVVLPEPETGSLQVLALLALAGWAARRRSARRA
jgi:hypothetical protein